MLKDEKQRFNFQDSFYEDQEFNNITLKEGILKDVEFFNCSFRSCDFFKLKLQSCEFEKCIFELCDLSLINMKNIKLLDVEFNNSKLVGVNWSGTVKPSNYNFNNCKLDDSIFYKLDIHSIKIVNCSAKNSDFIEADLSRGVFTNTDFEGSKFYRTNLSLTDFSQAYNYNIDPNNNKLKKTIFSLPDAVSLLNVFDIVIK